MAHWQGRDSAEEKEITWLFLGSFIIPTGAEAHYNCTQMHITI